VITRAAGGVVAGQLQDEGAEGLSPLAAHLLFELSFYHACDDADEAELLYAEEVQR
jgi:hypothetical protein